MFVMCINFIHTDMCINLTSFVESCWTGNLRILHSPLTTGEWTGTQATRHRVQEELLFPLELKMNCLHIAEELSRFENGAFSVCCNPGTVDRMEIMAQKMLYDSLFLGFFIFLEFNYFIYLNTLYFNLYLYKI